jgi:hypothetical protein
VLDVYAAPISGTANLMLLVRWAGAICDRCRARAMERTLAHRTLAAANLLVTAAVPEYARWRAL